VTDPVNLGSNDYLGLNTWNVNSTLFAPNADRLSVNRNIQTLTAGVNFKF